MGIKRTLTYPFTNASKLVVDTVQFQLIPALPARFPAAKVGGVPFPGFSCGCEKVEPPLTSTGHSPGHTSDFLKYLSEVKSDLVSEASTV